jgi:16S rRNA U516 pseudouridylate synthase RsuA-like enzyme
MTAALGFSVRELKRVRIGNIRLGNLKSGQMRPIEGRELETFLEEIKLN